MKFEQKHTKKTFEMLVVIAKRANMSSNIGRLYSEVTNVHTFFKLFLIKTSKNFFLIYYQLRIKRLLSICPLQFNEAFSLRCRNQHKLTVFPLVFFWERHLIPCVKKLWNTAFKAFTNLIPHFHLFPLILNQI